MLFDGIKGLLLVATVYTFNTKIIAFNVYFFGQADRYYACCFLICLSYVVAFFFPFIY